MGPSVAGFAAGESTLRNIAQEIPPAINTPSNTVSLPAHPLGHRRLRSLCRDVSYTLPNNSNSNESLDNSRYFMNILVIGIQN